jgi:hypothetical protein
VWNKYLLLNGNVCDRVYNIHERMTCFWSDVDYFKLSVLRDPTWLRGFYRTAIILKEDGDIAPGAGRVCWISFLYFGIARLKQEVDVMKEVVCDVHVRMWRASHVK